MGDENQQNQRLGNNAKKDLEELKIAVKAILEAIKAAEKELGEPLMAEGEYLGVKFED